MAGALLAALLGLIVVGMSAGLSMLGRRPAASQKQPESVIAKESSDKQEGGKQEDSGQVKETSAKGTLGNLEWRDIEKKSKEIYSIVQKYFLFDENETEVEEYIYKGLMAGLDDPYSVYYTTDEFAQLMEQTTGSYSGIGAMVSKNMTTGVISIAKVFKGTPAEEAGLMVDDVFYQVGDLVLTADMDLDILVKQYVKGPEGTTVDLRMYRPSAEKYIDVKVERRKIEVPTIEHEMKEGQIGYIEVSQFEDVTQDQFKLAVDELSDKGMKGLILDLRGNPGGVLDVAVSMADYLLPDDLTQYAKGKKKTLVVSTADRDGKGSSYYCSDKHSLDIPMVILINGNSASASEVVAGALKDYERATLVGTTTFGKGIVQNVIPFEDGSAIKLTTAHYYSPSGFDLHGVGIAPDVEIEFEIPEEVLEGKEFTDEDDNQLQKAIEVMKEKIGN